MLPTAVLANILEHLGDEAGEVVRAASACKALWAASAGPFTKVHHLIVRCCGPDLSAQQLLSLHQHFPAIQQLSVAEGCWQWTGCRSLHAWSQTLTALHANHTSCPIAAAVPQRTEQAACSHLAGSSVQQLRVMPGAVVGPLQQGTAQQQRKVVHEEQQQQQQQTMAVVPVGLQGLTQLQLGGIVTSPVRCRSHGSSECDCLDYTVLAAFLQQNAQLRVLSLAGNAGLPDRLLRAAVLEASCRQLHTLSLAGCECVCPRSYVPAAFPLLEVLDLSHTAVTDQDVQQLAEGLPCLRQLDLNGCKRVSNASIGALAAAPALASGCLISINLGGLTRPGSSALSALTAAWSRACGYVHDSTTSSSSCHGSSNWQHGSATAVGPGKQQHQPGQKLLHVGFSRTTGVTDSALLAFVHAAMPAAAGVASSSGGEQEQLLLLRQQLDQLSLRAEGQQSDSQQQDEQQVGTTGWQGVGLCALHLAGCNTVSSGVLLQLGCCGALQQLTSLDLCDMEAFRATPAQQHTQLRPPHEAAPWHEPVQGCCSSSSSGGQPGSPLPLLLQCIGPQLQVLQLDGSYLDDTSATAIAAKGFPQLTQLSLVGCKGLGNVGLRSLLATLPGLQDLSLGGSVSAWSEGVALPGLPVLVNLTQLRLLRRPLLRDADLAPVLAAAAERLRSLSLVGCYMLTDKLFELVADTSPGPSPGPPAGSSDAEGAGGVVPASSVLAALSASPSCHGQGSWQVGVSGEPLQQQLTQLCLAACDGISGSSLARLRGLRHLRIAFCASLSTTALQHVVVSCTRLSLLELPASLSSQGLGFDAVRFDCATSSGPVATSRHRSNNLRAGRRRFEAAGRGGRACARGVQPRIRAERVNTTGLVLPQQGGGQAQRLQGLRVKWIS